MLAKDVVRRYFDALAQKTGWQAFLADSFSFHSFVSPPKQVAGKAAYLEATQRFFSMISAVEVRDLIVDGAKVCALTRYQLRSPGGIFQSDVAEIFSPSAMARSIRFRFTSTVPPFRNRGEEHGLC